MEHTLEHTLEQQKTIGVRYAALASAVLGVTIGTGAAADALALPGWLAIFGAGMLVALLALREMLANELGVLFRSSRGRRPGPAAAVIVRRLHRTDGALIAFMVLFGATLVVASVAGR